MILTLTKKTSVAFATNARGERIAGRIDGAAATTVGCKSASICVEHGIGGAAGYGLAHIEGNESRMTQIRGLGYESAAAFVFDICGNWDTISTADKGRITISKSILGYALKAVLQLSEVNGHQFWSVVTAIPGRKIRENERLYSR